MTRSTVRLRLAFAALLVGISWQPATLQAAGSCVGSFGTQVDCIIDAATDSGPLVAPRDAGVSLLGNEIYTFTVNNPASLWDISAAASFPSVTANGHNPHLPFVVGQPDPALMNGFTSQWASLVAQVGATYFPVATGGAVISGLAGALKLMIWDVDLANNSGTQSVTVALNSDPNLLAGVNVFAKQHALTQAGAGADTGLTLVAGNKYLITPTDITQTYGLGTPGPGSTAEGLPVFGLCGVACTLGNGNSFGDAGVTGFEFGELVAWVGADDSGENGKFYKIGTGRTLEGLNGRLFLLIWDSDALDNYGFINARIDLVATDVVPAPEPASLMLLSGGLMALWFARRRRDCRDV